jgi:prepilin-type processing-associated H-X9-DG protein
MPVFVSDTPDKPSGVSLLIPRNDEAQSFGTFYAPPGNTWGTHGTMSNRHSEGANIGFYDGHAKWMSREAAWAMPYYDFN